MKTHDSIKHSMLWAVYGDALGFITELCDEQGLRYRTDGLSRVTGLTPWKRKLGGKYGVSASIIKGCYSDDTQLRLAVGRSINRKGKFDYEAFSKVELPVFLSYGLGVGRGTKAACESLQKATVQWNTNFYNSKGSDYFKSGGNGAAMRIQPHVWVAQPDTTITSLVTEILKNSIITHGHPIALVGAVFHGLSLYYTFEHGTCPEPNQWLNILDKTRQITEICSNDEELSSIWLPQWEIRSGLNFKQGICDAIMQMRKDVEVAIRLMEVNHNGDEVSLYARVVNSLDGLNPAVRGSATKTALLANYLGFAFKNNPLNGICACVNTLGSDTDTIATMAGALLGACCGKEPPEEVLDSEYILLEAERYFNLSIGEGDKQFFYPDLMVLNLPKSHLDYVGTYEKKYALCGLGLINPIGEQLVQEHGSAIFVWQYYKLSFGQTILLKHRKELQILERQTLPIASQHLSSRPVKFPPSSRINTAPITHANPSSPTKPTQPGLPFKPLSISSMADEVARNGFKEAEIGQIILRLASEDLGIEKAIAFVAIILKAKQGGKI